MGGVLWIADLSHERLVVEGGRSTVPNLGVQEKIGTRVAHAWPGVSGWKGGMQHIGHTSGSRHTVTFQILRQEFGHIYI